MASSCLAHVFSYSNLAHNRHRRCHVSEPVLSMAKLQMSRMSEQGGKEAMCDWEALLMSGC